MNQQQQDFSKVWHDHNNNKIKLREERDRKYNEITSKPHTKKDLKILENWFHKEWSKLVSEWAEKLNVTMEKYNVYF